MKTKKERAIFQTKSLSFILKAKFVGGTNIRVILSGSALYLIQCRIFSPPHQLLIRSLSLSLWFLLQGGTKASPRLLFKPLSRSGEGTETAAAARLAFNGQYPSSICKGHVCVCVCLGFAPPSFEPLASLFRPSLPTFLTGLLVWMTLDKDPCIGNQVCIVEQR